MPDPIFTPLTLGAIAICYLIGSIPSGYIVAKKMMGIDIREHGSGNVGATNVKRVVGSKAGRIVLFSDFAKALLPVLAARLWLFPEMPEVHVLMALAVLLGHSRSIFLGFTGGKSAISGLGAMFAMAPLAALIVGTLVFTIFKMTRIVSIATLSACVATPLSIYLLHYPQPYVLYGLAASIMITYLHRANIVRLIKGTENRLER